MFTKNLARFRGPRSLGVEFDQTVWAVAKGSRLPRSADSNPTVIDVMARAQYEDFFAEPANVAFHQRDGQMDAQRPT
jgi:hypothetical protein